MARISAAAVSRRTRGAGVIALFALSGWGCGGDDGGGSPPSGGLVIGSDGYSVAFDKARSTIEVRRGREALLTLPVDSFVVGRVDEVSDSANYDPWPVVAQNTALPPGLAFRSAITATARRTDARTLNVDLEFEGGTLAALEISERGPGNFRATLSPQPGGEPLAFYRLRPRVSDSEGFYGLGEVFDTVEHRGKLRAMQLELDLSLESSYNEAHVPIPFVIGTRGWGMFVESSYPGVFDVAASEPDRVAATFGTGTASGDGLIFHLFAAEHPLDVTKQYYEVTGYPKLPARWALGPLIWRDENRDQAQVEADLDAIRDLDLATTAVWIDRPYATGVNTFDFDAAKFTNAQAMIDKAHALGFRMALWQTPYLDQRSPATQLLRDEATANGYFPAQHGLQLNSWGPVLDLTNTAAFAWWQGLIRRYTTQGIEGFKLDYGEDVVPGLPGLRNVFRFADGSDERTMHRGYALVYHRVYAETLPSEGGFLLCRAGKYGDQKNGGVIWPGDLDANFAKHGDPIGDGKKYVGGLPASLVAALSLGPSGFAFYGSDTGGYRHSPPDKETFTRWFEQTALSSVMQVGTSSNDVAWEPTPENGFDQEMLDWYRRYARLHLRIWPYLWTYAKNLATDGRPIMRALGLAYPELGVHPTDTYLLGDHLLVAPVVERGARTRSVVLPPGTWVDFWTGQAHPGGTTIEVAAPLDFLPLFEKSSGILPMLRPTIDTLNPTTDPARVDSYATSAGTLWVRIVPGPASRFTLFDGAAIEQEQTGTGVRLATRDGGEFREGVMFELIGLGQKPAGVNDGGNALTERASLAELDSAAGFTWDAAATGGTLYVRVLSGEHRLDVRR